MATAYYDQKRPSYPPPSPQYQEAFPSLPNNPWMDEREQTQATAYYGQKRPSYPPLYPQYQEAFPSVPYNLWNDEREEIQKRERWLWQAVQNVEYECMHLEDVVPVDLPLVDFDILFDVNLDYQARLVVGNLGQLKTTLPELPRLDGRVPDMETRGVLWMIRPELEQESRPDNPIKHMRLARGMDQVLERNGITAEHAARAYDVWQGQNRNPDDIGQPILPNSMILGSMPMDTNIPSMNLDHNAAMGFKSPPPIGHPQTLPFRHPQAPAFRSRRQRTQEERDEERREKEERKRERESKRLENEAKVKEKEEARQKREKKKEDDAKFAKEKREEKEQARSDKKARDAKEKAERAEKRQKRKQEKEQGTTSKKRKLDEADLFGEEL